MNRRSFLAALAALPLATKIEPQKTGLTTLTYGKYTQLARVELTAGRGDGMFERCIGTVTVMGEAK